MGKIFAVVILALAMTSSPAISAEVAGDEKIVVEYPPGLSPQSARDFAALLASERGRIRQWWGATFENEIRVKIVEERGPSMALVPAWRGEHGVMRMPLVRVKGNDAASLHEMVHIYAPNANRLLAEGLAVYAHEHLKGRRAHPNAGRDLHEMAAATTAAMSLVELDKVATPQPLERGGDETKAYVAGGSFVRFLIERDGLEKFRALYALTPLQPGKREAGSPERWQTIYGQPLSALEQAWRQFLSERFPPQPTTRTRN